MVEEKLLVAVDPLTIGQRCADWFLMKSMLLSGTMAGKIVGAMTGRDTSIFRTAASTIEAAEAARSRHGKTVICVFGDDIFNDCVPAANRSQVMHQAVVTQFDYGMFVTSKVDDSSGRILQVVIIEIPTATREEHASKLCAIANPLLGFLHRQNIVERGFLTDDDCPSRVTATQGTILKKRAKLYYAHLKLIIDTDGRLHPMPPLLLYKHSAQYRYNNAKPGLDMNTEISANVGCAARCGIEGKYVFRMLDAVMVNTWRAYQAVTDIAPWLATLDSTPSLKQLRNHLYRKGSIRQFVFNTSYESLRLIAIQKTIIRQFVFNTSYESLRLIAIQKTIIRPPFFPPANTHSWRNLLSPAIHELLSKEFMAYQAKRAREIC
ncbi:hypothetical protein IV203_023363 [Nitzschia inconspicua]|uniref:Uncharacterized protein n=1 Tax=Nitzschia inconspicua TaxID=303405 RepID=A0A9K3PC79_9STRA|nr:hypothetical protein IV203_023363 [Nitzschia inconspicua]